MNEKTTMDLLRDAYLSLAAASAAYAGETAFYSPLHEFNAQELHRALTKIMAATDELRDRQFTQSRKEQSA